MCCSTVLRASARPRSRTSSPTSSAYISSRPPAPLLQIKGDLTAIITNLLDKQVLFIDEIHRLQPVLEELLYSALEDYKLDIIIGQGPSARTHTLEVRPFTFVGATTRAGLISAPLRARFGIVLRLEFYTAEDLRVIVRTLRRNSGSRNRQGRRDRDRQPFPWHSAHRQPPPAPCSRLCAGAQRGEDRPADGQGRAGDAGSGSIRLR